MRKIITCIFALLIYAASAYQLHNFFRVVYSKGGRFEGLNAGVSEVVMTFFPVINTIWALCSLCTDAYPSGDKRNHNANNIFNIKYSAPLKGGCSN